MKAVAQIISQFRSQRLKLICRGFTAFKTGVLHFKYLEAKEEIMKENLSSFRSPV